MEKEKFFNERFNHGVINFDKVTLMFDGSCGPTNPNGNMGYGYAVMADGDIVSEGWGYTIFDGTPSSNNIAEWFALYNGLHLLSASNLSYNSLEIKGDSNLVIMQAIGQWKIKEGLYAPYARRTLSEFGELLKSARIYHVRREFNDYCDHLSNKYISYLMDNFGFDTGGEFKLK